MCFYRSYAFRAYLTCSWAIYKYGTEEQKQMFLRPLAEGKMLGAYSLTESGSGSDAGAMRTTAIKDGDIMSSTAPNYLLQMEVRRRFTLFLR